ncbi:MAG: tetratricopeptide repeat protein [Cyanobacteria bacterium J083]|nr:MAG: tetratricopeptide repeat protein [Cyanobacteria bacterium J083]
MIRLIAIISCFLLIFNFAPLAWGETQSTFPYTEAQIQQGEKIAKKALAASEQGNFSQAEAYWDDLVSQFPDNPAVWSNRGNTRLSQNKIEEAIADYNQAIAIDPHQPDPYLNRGIAYEAAGNYEKAIADYNQVLALTPQDAMAYNNRGNAEAGQKSWTKALADYQKAIELVPNFALARANEALMEYQIGQDELALRKFRNLVLKYPLFPDVRAALTAVLWEQGKQGEAESNWVAAIGMDSRYQDLDWIEHQRRWPPRMVDALEKFLKLN